MVVELARVQGRTTLLVALAMQRKGVCYIDIASLRLSVTSGIPESSKHNNVARHSGPQSENWFQPEISDYLIYVIYASTSSQLPYRGRTQHHVLSA